MQYVILLLLLIMPISSFASERNAPLTLEYFRTHEPLTVLPFDDKLDIYYQTKVFDDIKHVVRQDPTAFFEILVVFRTVGDFKYDKQEAAKAAGQAFGVAEFFGDIGLANDQYRIRYTNETDATHNQIRIYVR